MANPHRNKKCGKELPCSHLCQNDVGNTHICRCTLKWTVDPGCGHVVTGDCTRSITVATTEKCKATCGIILDCNHACKEACSVACVCKECDAEKKLGEERRKIAAEIEQAPKEIPIKKRGKKFPPPPEVQAQLLKSRFMDTAISTGDEKPSTSKSIPAKEGVKTFPQPTPPKIQSPATFTNYRIQPVLKLKLPTFSPSVDDYAANKGNNRRPSPQQPTSRVTASENSSGNANIWSDLQPGKQIAPHLWEQIKKLLPASSSDQIGRVFCFSSCVNQHIFYTEEIHCHECGGTAYGEPYFIKRNNSSGFPSGSTPVQNPLFVENDQHIAHLVFAVGADAEMNQEDMALAIAMIGNNVDPDDFAFRMGYAKCSNGHYYHQNSPHCPECGEPSPFYLPDSD